MSRFELSGPAETRAGRVPRNRPQLTLVKFSYSQVETTWAGLLPVGNLAGKSFLYGIVMKKLSSGDGRGTVSIELLRRGRRLRFAPRGRTLSIRETERHRRSSARSAFDSGRAAV